MRKQFECGHTGKGKYCHTCKAKELAQQKKVEARHEKIKVQQTDAIDLAILSHYPNLQKKARKIIQAIQEGHDYRQYNGKGIIAVQKEVISVPLGEHYRILFAAQELKPLKVLHHSDYNNLLSSDKLLKNLPKYQQQMH